jgi:hypothetical protein
MTVETLTGYISVQTENNGHTSEDRIKSISNSLVPSANALRKQLEALKASDATQESTSDPNSDTAQENYRSTETYHFEITADKAILALQAIDKQGNTEAFDARYTKYMSVREAVGNPKDLPLDQKIEAIKKLNQVSFSSYCYQVSIRVPGNPTTGDKFIRSKKHHRMENLSEKSTKAILEAYVSKWIDKDPEGVKPNQSPSHEAATAPGEDDTSN